MLLLGATICHVSTRARLDIGVIARRLTDRRAELRLEQTEVAERAGLSRAYVSRLEAGIVPNPKLFDLQRVADVLDIPLSALVAPDRSERREVFIAEGADVLAAIADEPPELQASILRAVRQAYDIVKTARETRPG